MADMAEKKQALAENELQQVVSKEAFLKEAFKEFENVRNSDRRSIDLVIKVEGKHVYSQGLFKRLSSEFISSGSH